MRGAREPPPPRTFSHGSFDFSVSSGFIGDKHEYEALEEEVFGSGTRVHLPEMVFPSNAVSVRHCSSGVRLDFTAAGALRCWHEQQLRTHASGGGVSPENFDWTFATPFDGALCTEEEGGTVRGGVTPQLTTAPLVHAPAALRRGQGGGAAPPAFVDTPTRLPLGPTLDGDRPMLFFTSTQLYASDLDDRGQSETLVKLRVNGPLPVGSRGAGGGGTDEAAPQDGGFWFLLLRSWQRIDRSSIAVRDVRFMCLLPVGESGSDESGVPSSPPPLRILRNTQVRRAKWHELQAALSRRDEEAEVNGSAAAVRPSPAPLGVALGVVVHTSGEGGAVAAVMPAVSPRPVHPAVLQSIRERAARMGLEVDDNGHVVSAGTRSLAAAGDASDGAQLDKPSQPPMPESQPANVGLAVQEQGWAEDVSSDPFSLSNLRLAITPEEAFAALAPVYDVTAELYV